jgi:hypothetical protein
LRTRGAGQIVADGRLALPLAASTMRVACALLCVYVPIALMALWYRWDWGGTFSRNSGFWGWNGRVALSALACVTFLIIYLGPNGVVTGLFGGVSRVYGYFGIGFAIALFPGASSTLSLQYINLARAGMTSLFAIVGWTLIILASSVLLFSRCLQVGC